MSRPTKLHCDSAALTARGGPFCYDIPAGFKDISATASYSGTDPYRTAVEFYSAGGGAPRDLIVVTALKLTIDSDRLTDAQLFTTITNALGGAIPGVKSVARVTPVKVAGDRAFATTLDFTNGDQKRYVLVFAGMHRVSVSCQWRDHQGEVAAACTKVLGSLQIAFP